MFHLLEPATDATESNPLRRSPAVVVAAAVVLGILVDHAFDLAFTNWWITSACSLFVIGAIRMLDHEAASWVPREYPPSPRRRRFSLFPRRRQFSLFPRRREPSPFWRRLVFHIRWNDARLTSMLALFCCFGLGGTWHHWCWNLLASDDVSHWATDEGRLVRLRAKVIQAPSIILLSDEHAPWKQPERTITLIECRQLVGSNAQVTSVSGHVRLSVAGRLDTLAIGDLIEVSGRLILPSEPSNPGDFDQRRWLRAQGLHASLTADDPEAVAIMYRERTVADWFAVGRATVRQRAENLIATRLRSRNVAVAQSLLLGSRVELDRDLRRAFAESGTLHLLAISGMNVGLLWFAITVVCRIVRLPPTMSAITALVMLPAYALLTDANPPVVRATLVAVVMATGQLIGRQSNHFNSLAVAALLVLAWNPSDLFNAGAQLSFLAVATILATTRFVRSLRGVPSAARDSASSPSVIRSSWNWVARTTCEGFVIGIAIWVTTSPLIAAQFHLVSPIGVVITALLNIPIAIMFGLGYLFLFVGLVSPLLAGGFGLLFDQMLTWFLIAVEAASRFEVGHLYAPAPPRWWIVGFYVLVVSSAIWDQYKGRLFWSARAALVWSVVGLAVCVQPRTSNELSCTLLSVGHGLSILIECPNGRTLLYDAGSMMGGNRAARTIETTLWSHGHSRLDAVLISHPDSDHCNALPELANVIPIKTLLCHRSFLDWTQPPVAAALEHSASSGVDIRLIATGQEIELDPSVTLRILHPTPDFAGRTDNAKSLVLSIEYAGKRIVLTGDVELDGLRQLLRQDRLPTDVLLSPHHGSIAANPHDLARWATPEWLLVSSRNDTPRDRLSAVYGPSTQVMTTSKYGAIRCRITSDGDLSIEPFKQTVAARMPVSSP